MVSQARSGPDAGNGGFLSAGAPWSANCGVARGIEPVIGHMKTDGHLGRCHFKGREGEAANVILTAVGHNLRGVLAWPRALLRPILLALGAASRSMVPSRSPMPAPPQRLHSTAR